jgi:hypothetical protein
MKNDINKMKKILSDNLLLLAEYKNGDEKRCIAICKVLDFQTLSKLKGLSMPSVIFTQEEIKKAFELFPVEFLNIKRNHRILYGEDIFKDIEISKEGLKKQIKFEIYSKLIHLRSSYLMSDVQIEDIIFRAIPNLAPIVGAFLYIRGMETKYDPDLVKVMIGLDTKVLKDIYNIKTKKTKFKGDKNRYIERIINVLSQIEESIDKIVL